MRNNKPAKEEKSHRNKKRKFTREPEVRENIYLTRSSSRLADNRDVASREEQKTVAKEQPTEEKQTRRKLEEKLPEQEKLLDVTNEFFREFYRKKHIFVNKYAHGKSVKREGPCLRQRTTTTTTVNNTRSNSNREPTVNMFKLIQDFTWGARVVLRRISESQISRLLERDSLALNSS